MVRKVKMGKDGNYYGPKPVLKTPPDKMHDRRKEISEETIARRKGKKHG
jgi:hypothetical protein